MDATYIIVDGPDRYQLFDHFGSHKDIKLSWLSFSLRPLGGAGRREERISLQALSDDGHASGSAYFFGGDGGNLGSVIGLYLPVADPAHQGYTTRGFLLRVEGVSSYQELLQQVGMLQDQNSAAVRRLRRWSPLAVLTVRRELSFTPVPSYAFSPWASG